MNSAVVRRNLRLALPFLGLWILGLLACAHFTALVHDHGVLREAEPYEWLPYALARITTEVVALYVLLRPSSFRWSWGRVLMAFMVFAIWMGYDGGFGFHSPGWVLGHGYWLFGLCAGLLMLLIVSGVCAWRMQRRSVAA
jgi:hypothetical protein